jgi:hypothetical protein
MNYRLIEIIENPKLPIVLLVYAMETVLTTATCMYDYAFWTTVSYDVKVGLTTLYGPYLALCTLISLSSHASPSPCVFFYPSFAVFGSCGLHIRGEIG